jgi:hypothetical protein
MAKETGILFTVAFTAYKGPLQRKKWEQDSRAGIRRMAAQGHKTFTLQDNTLLLIPSNPKKNQKASRADRFLGHIFGTHNWKK